MAELLLGVDAGNTKTVALVATSGGQVVGHGRAGCGDIYGAGSEAEALAALDAAILEALTIAGAERPDLLAGGFSLAGADWPEDYALLEAHLRARGFGRCITVVNDGLGPLRAGSPDGTGVAVVCGTGLAVGARGPAGATWHGSFWLETRGARRLGGSALRAAVRAELGIAPPTSLTHRLSAFHGVGTVEEALHLFTRRRDDGRPPIADLATLLFDEAAAGDPVAGEIVDRAGEEIAAYALVAARRVHLPDTPWPLVLAGGVFRHPSQLLARAIAAGVQREYPTARPVRPRLEPAAGALLLGFDTAGIVTTPEVMAAIAATLPPHDVFATGG